MIIKIIKLGFKKLDFFISPTTDILTILKAIIFINNIKIVDKMTTYL